jgi:hypothetical protein
MNTIAADELNFQFLDLNSKLFFFFFYNNKLM